MVPNADLNISRNIESAQISNNDRDKEVRDNMSASDSINLKQEASFQILEPRANEWQDGSFKIPHSTESRKDEMSVKMYDNSNQIGNLNRIVV